MIPVKKFQLNYLKELKLRRKMFLKFLRRPKYLCLNSSFFNDQETADSGRNSMFYAAMFDCTEVLKRKITNLKDIKCRRPFRSNCTVEKNGKLAILFFLSFKKFSSKKWNFFMKYGKCWSALQGFFIKHSKPLISDEWQPMQPIRFDLVLSRILFSQK